MQNKFQPQLTARARMLRNVISVLFAQRKLAGAPLPATRGARHLSLPIRLHNPLEIDKALGLSEPLALASNTSRVIAQRQAGLVIYQFELRQSFWEVYTRSDLPKVEAIGLAERRQPVDFDFKQPHALVAGSTNSGKSETIKSVLLSLMESHKPDDLGIVLIDLHNDYDDFQNEAHLIRFDYGTIANDAADIDTALMWTNQQLAQRKRENIKDAKRIVLVIDEADKVLSDDSRLEIVQSISTEGRKFKINVIVGTQKPSHKTLPRILDNLLNRFVGLVSDANVSVNLTGKSGLQAHLLTGQGDFLHIDGADSKRFQVAMVSNSDYQKLERGEIQTIETVTQSDIVELPPIVEQVSAGRPKLELQPDVLAWYLYHHGVNVSRQTAADSGFTRTIHELHKGFADSVASEYIKLQKQSLLRLEGK